jgi:hypothetical protein
MHGGTIKRVDNMFLNSYTVLRIRNLVRVSTPFIPSELFEHSFETTPPPKKKIKEQKLNQSIWNNLSSITWLQQV